MSTLAFSPRRLPAAERSVQLYSQDKKEPSNFRGFSHRAWRELRERRELFSDVFAQHLTLVAVGEGTQARRVLGMSSVPTSSRCSAYRRRGPRTKYTPGNGAANGTRTRDPKIHSAGQQNALIH